MNKTFLGIELGSTRIKAVSIDENHKPVSSGDYVWASSYENGIWTYDLDEAWGGLKAALSGIENRESIASMGISAMMHGYLAFDKDWNLLVPFRTWQNTVTAQAAEELTAPYGMALLAAYRVNKGNESLEEYLNNHVFADAKGTTLAPWQADVDGFNAYIEQYKKLLAVERKAVEMI